MRDAMQGVFDTLLMAEPPLSLTAANVRQRGQRRLRRRRVLVACGSVAGVILTASTAVAYGPVGGPLVAQPALTGSADVDPSAARTASADPTPSYVSPPATQFEIPACDGDGTPKKLVDTDGSVLPEPQAAAQAVLAKASTLAPGRSFTVVTATREDTSAKHPGAPREYIIFDVTDAHGTGSVNLELIPQAGMSPADRAAIDLRAKPFSNCTGATLADFPDGAVGLLYNVAFGTGAASDSVQHTYYYGPGLDINAGAFLTSWSDLSGASGARTSMPLTTTEVLNICRVVALS